MYIKKCPQVKLPQCACLRAFSVYTGALIEYHRNTNSFVLPIPKRYSLQFLFKQILLFQNSLNDGSQEKSEIYQKPNSHYEKNEVNKACPEQS